MLVIEIFIVLVVDVKELSLSTLLSSSDAPADCSGTVVVEMVPPDVFFLPFVFDSLSFFFLVDTREALSPVVIFSSVLVVVGRGVWMSVAVFAFFLGLLPIVVVVEAMTALVSMAVFFVGHTLRLQWHLCC